MQGNKVRLFGISGFKKSGKTTVAKLLSYQINKVEGYVCKITNYADTLKRSAAALFDIDQNWFYKDDLKEQRVPGLCCEITPREIMTAIHDGLVPMFGENLFVHPVKADWGRFRGHQGAFIVGDVRYEGRETDWIREAGGVIIHVRRDSAVPGFHSSEQGVQFRDGDFLLDNNGSIADLERKIETLLIETRNHYPVP